MLDSTQPQAMPWTDSLLGDGQPLRVGILTINYFPERLGIGRVADELSTGLAQLGHSVVVVTSFPHYPEFEVHRDYRWAILGRERRSDRVEVFRSFVHASPRATFGAKALWYGSFTASSVLNFLRMGRLDVLLVVSPPPTLCLPAAAWQAFTRTPIILNVQDIVPDAAITYGMMTNKVVIAVFKALERFAYRVSDEIAVVAPGFRTNLIRKGVDEDKITVIPNWVDTDTILPQDRVNGFRDTHRLGADAFVVLYAGNIGMSQGLEVVLEAADRLRSHSDIRFLIVGAGTMRRELVERAHAIGLPNVTFLPPDQDAASMYAAADLALVLQRPNVLDVNFPSKIAVIMASGRPILAGLNAAGDAAHVVVEANAGALIEPGNAEELAAAVLRLRADPVSRQRYGDSGRRFALANFSRQSAIAAYERLIRKAVQDRIRTA
jgi:colanic acid biosynthesis glycosyl transferase WcaI